jgi:glycosyltransferase involved in cell wall biosynthesis
LSRNIGAKAATGEYIIFTVQDAYFPDQYAFTKIVNFIKENNLAAASGYQIPYKDADIFAKWQFIRHYDFMNPKRQNIIYRGEQLTQKLNTLGFLAKRKLINIDDVFSCFKSSIFKQYYFSESIRFAEDAEIALRLLRDNYNIGTAMFSEVHHSHSRDFLYHFKRTYADSQTLNFIFHGSLHRVNGNLENNVYFVLNLMIIIELNLINKKGSRMRFWQDIEADLKKRIPIKEYQKSLFYSRFIKLLDKIDFFNHIQFDRDNYIMYKNDISLLWEAYSQFCKQNHHKISNDGLLKVTSAILAGYLGEIAYKIPNPQMKEVLGLLTESV